MHSSPQFNLAPSSVTLLDVIISELRAVESTLQLDQIIATVAREFGFYYYALIDHDDLCRLRPNCVDIKHYPAAIVDSLIGKRRYRRDPVIRACLVAGSAFVWSDLDRIINLDKRDRNSFELGAREGLNEGITVPFIRLGDRVGSCTFAGMPRPERAHQFLGPMQLVGIFAFQAARRLVSGAVIPPPVGPRLHPRPRDCVVLAGRGQSNKEIARALALTPRTVDCYLTEARRLFDVHDRTELVISALLAGEIGLHELRRQPE